MNKWYPTRRVTHGVVDAVEWHVMHVAVPSVHVVSTAAPTKPEAEQFRCPVNSLHYRCFALVNVATKQVSECILCRGLSRSRDASEYRMLPIA
jgi:hypothetical protein